ncbi:MAG: response regulator [Sphingobacteriaceae bacterium]|nr:response regulator [Sphingobacteriaceae bacterium]
MHIVLIVFVGILRIPLTISPSIFSLNFLVFVAILILIATLNILYLKRQRKQRAGLENQFKEQLMALAQKQGLETQEAEPVQNMQLSKANFAFDIVQESLIPLSLALSTAKEILKESPLHRGELQRIERYISCALRLGNQVIDIQKLDAGQVQASLNKGDLVAFVSDLTQSFSDLALHRNVNLLFETESASLNANFDHAILESTLFNLLNYSFKVSSQGKEICVYINVKRDNIQDFKGIAEIKIITSDTRQKPLLEAPDIRQIEASKASFDPEDDLSLLAASELCGICRGQLTMVKEKHELMFTILFPIEYEEDSPSEIPEAANRAEIEQNNKEGFSSITEKKPSLLLVEDNAEMRAYLRDNLKQDFTVLEAANGKEGWQKALALHPNLIVSDVNMPEMNGIDLCKKIRSDKRTTHIPVILLTALGDEYSQISGLKYGANDYIIKPFNTKVLASKIHNLLSFKDTLKKTYQKQVDIQVKDMNIESEDDKFVSKLLHTIDKNISNPEFSVELLSSTMAMSRVALYRKILSVTGKSPVEFIRKIRMEKAVQLLQKSKMPISRVAYEVGYSNPNYFAKVFREEYNMLPSEYISSLRVNENTDSKG